MSELQGLKGLGPRRIETLTQAGITSIEQLLDTLPQSYLFAGEPVPIADLGPGDACVFARVKSLPVNQYFGGRSISRANLFDDSGSIQAIWFNQPWTVNQMEPGQPLLLAGKVQLYRNKLSLINPKRLESMGIHPQYKPLPSLPGKVFLSLVSQALELVDARRVEIFPLSFRNQHRLVSRKEAWRMAHQPASQADIDKAKRRLAFENLLLYQMALKLAGPQGKPGLPIAPPGFDPGTYWATLPFTPTDAQRKTLHGIIADMQKPVAMRRLVQGDVGSGKTAVALGAAAYAIAGGYQVALMAPTELLARQHLKSADSILAAFNIQCILLTGSMKGNEKRQALARVKRGESQLVIGTHALISAGVTYKNLGLVITDEQHRFGVRQRQTLADRADTDVSPHILALSATPIPRSLALAIYGDLQVSVMDQLPPGRQLVKTRIVPESRRQDLYSYIRAKAEVGEQSFLVCPLVEDSEITEIASAVGLYAQLSRGALKGIPMALTYGGQAAEEKEKALGSFYEGKAKVLVSTTVIEVGMDVPNATTMVIENADRFGLAQLHQLRGRVGRGSKESWCFLLGEPNERLTTLAASNDGFVIAQKDLELRGPGEFLGTQQHGRMLNSYGINDLRLVEETGRILADILGQEQHARLRKMLETAAEHHFAKKLAEAAMH